jgi:methionyl-tRNA synthetase
VTDPTPGTPAPGTPTPTPGTPAPASATAPKPTITFDDFAKIDLRVATVLAAEPHPNADRLLKLQIDLGELGTRQICAGVKAYYSPEQMVGRQIIVVANLEPRKIRGEASNGMLLAASARDGEQVTDVILLGPSKPAPAGSTVG